MLSTSPQRSALDSVLSTARVCRLARCLFRVRYPSRLQGIHRSLDSNSLKKGCENQSRKVARAYPDDDLHCSVALSGGIDGINLCPKSPSTSKTSMFLF